MRIALILSGNIRTWDKCKNSYIGLLEKYKPDVYISTYDKRYDYHPYIKSTLKEYKDYTLSQIDIENHFKDIEVINMEIEKTTDIDYLVNKEMLLFHSDMRHINSCFKQFRKIQNCINNIIKYENENNFKYDYIIKMRFDTIINNIDILPSNDNSIVINDYGILPNDWTITSNRNNFIKIIKSMIDEFYIMKYSNSGDSPPHQLLENVSIMNNLIFEKRNICKKIIRIHE